MAWRPGFAAVLPQCANWCPARQDLKNIFFRFYMVPHHPKFNRKLPHQNGVVVPVVSRSLGCVVGKLRSTILRRHKKKVTIFRPEHLIKTPQTLSIEKAVTQNEKNALPVQLGWVSVIYNFAIV